MQGFNAGQPTEGGYNVQEIFGELNIPFETESGMRLELTGAGRYSDYSLSNVGGVWTYSGGVQFSPIPDITFRGQYQRAVRAPNVGELFQGSAIGFPGANDPCATAAASTGGLRTICAANGVSATLLDQLGSSDPAVVANASDLIQPDTQIAAFFGGNPNLSEETSDSYTFGVALTAAGDSGLLADDRLLRHRYRRCDHHDRSADCTGPVLQHDPGSRRTTVCWLRRHSRCIERLQPSDCTAAWWCKRRPS